MKSTTFLTACASLVATLSLFLGAPAEISVGPVQLNLPSWTVPAPVVTLDGEPLEAELSDAAVSSRERDPRALERPGEPGEPGEPGDPEDHWDSGEPILEIGGSLIGLRLGRGESSLRSKRPAAL